jgi:hypothetical protein
MKVSTEVRYEIHLDLGALKTTRMYFCHVSLYFLFEIYW